MESRLGQVQPTVNRKLSEEARYLPGAKPTALKDCIAKVKTIYTYTASQKGTLTLSIVTLNRINGF